MGKKSRCFENMAGLRCSSLGHLDEESQLFHTVSTKSMITTARKCRTGTYKQYICTVLSQTKTTEVADVFYVNNVI